MHFTRPRFPALLRPRLYRRRNVILLPKSPSLSSFNTIRMYQSSKTAMASGSVSQLLSQIQDNTKRYLEFFESRGLPEPSYEAGDGLDPLQPPPNDVKAFRDAAIEAADELHHLLLGPLGLLLNSPGDVSAPADVLPNTADILSISCCSVCSTFTRTGSLSTSRKKARLSRTLPATADLTPTTCDAFYVSPSLVTFLGSQASAPLFIPPRPSFW